MYKYKVQLRTEGLHMFTKEEIALLDQALDMAIASQKRGQNSSKNPQLVVVYEAIERDLVQLKAKVLTQKPK